jgi:hypothetical protein
MCTCMMAALAWSLTLGSTLPSCNTAKLCQGCRATAICRENQKETIPLQMESTSMQGCFHDVGRALHDAGVLNSMAAAPPTLLKGAHPLGWPHSRCVSQAGGRSRTHPPG